MTQFGQNFRVDCCLDPRLFLSACVAPFACDRLQLEPLALFECSYPSPLFMTEFGQTFRGLTALFECFGQHRLHRLLVSQPGQSTNACDCGCDLMHCAGLWADGGGSRYSACMLGSGPVPFTMWSVDRGPFMYTYIYIYIKTYIHTCLHI